MKVSNRHTGRRAIDSFTTGTGFLQPTVDYTTETIRSSVIANMTPSIVPQSTLEAAVDTLLELYPDVPAAGSPFFTGDSTLGVSRGFKRAAALSGSISPICSIVC